MFSTEEDLENASLHETSNLVGVVFLDNMSYRLRFHHSQLPLPSDFTESIGELEPSRDRTPPRLPTPWAWLPC